MRRAEELFDDIEGRYAAGLTDFRAETSVYNALINCKTFHSLLALFFTTVLNFPLLVCPLSLHMLQAGQKVAREKRSIELLRFYL